MNEYFGWILDENNEPIADIEKLGIKEKFNDSRVEVFGNIKKIGKTSPLYADKRIFKSKLAFIMVMDNPESIHISPELDIKKDFSFNGKLELGKVVRTYFDILKVDKMSEEDKEGIKKV